MNSRIIDISSGPARLSVQNSQLVIALEDNKSTVPIEDTAIVLLNHPGVSLTGAVLTALPENKVAIVHCGSNQMPVSLTLPYQGNTLQGERLRQQLGLSRPFRKRLWQRLVQTKIRMQAATLDALNIPSANIRHMARHVKSGDEKNHEAQAAQRYWPLLMGRGFRRDRNGLPPNNLLNFGYAVMRSAVARAICLSGLNPGIGLFHQSRSNSFPLADDLMEVWRPVIDWRVHQLVTTEQNITELDKQTKQKLLSVFYESVSFGTESLPLLLAIQRMVTSVALSFEQNGDGLILPSGLTSQADFLVSEQ